MRSLSALLTDWAPRSDSGPYTKGWFPLRSWVTYRSGWITHEERDYEEVLRELEFIFGESDSMESPRELASHVVV